MWRNEDCNPGDSISEGSERLLQKGSGGRSIFKGKREFRAIKLGFLLVTGS